MDAKTLEARARAEGTPVIEGDTATFVWRGRGPVSLLGDFQDWRGEPLPLERVAPGLWARTVTLPRDAYAEYVLLDSRGDKVEDTFNPRTSDNGFGDTNHCFYMPEGAPPEILQRPRGAPRGRVTRHMLETEDMAVGGRRSVALYAPPVPGPVPLMVVFDGDDYLKRVKLPEVVESLMARGLMGPVALALVSNGGEARSVEYSCSEYTVDLLLKRVLPLAHEHLSLVEEPGAHAVLGSSLGGLMALFTGMRVPEVFGRVLAQSGAFAIEGRDFVVFDLARQTPRRPLDVWMDCGRFEVLLEGNQRMAPLLRSSGHRVEYREYNAGHNYPAWRDDLWRGLQWLFPVSSAKRR
ncbi:alpha/beta hydrolase-fold protein [Pyxidicoccus sp. MSG2]|uniref:alpha/beta hydrolase-fold protein n=1 Tax=Pyxidicoccus sp. MSG2 TaxID=2996790 RepID=UPI00226EBB35|nr:alpha/beta hydrolase-fold protein [Pyxidicoccus sp. MSG2]MCY1017024.1 alpha/beta hydrolase-fold protein [Pyxidicoccus sp. MSG2]